MRSYEEVLSVSPANPLENVDAAIAEELVYHLHQGVDWNVWGGPRSKRYWEALAERVKASTYAGPTLLDWWQSATTTLDSAPRSIESRKRVVTLLQSEGQRSVMKSLRNNAVILVLRLRVHMEAVLESEKK